MKSCLDSVATRSHLAHRFAGALQGLRLPARLRRGPLEAGPELCCQAATAKGFGQKTAEAGGQGKAKGRAKKVADASVDGTSRQAVQKAIKAVERDKKARPVDPREAAKGRLDYVQVKDWGGGKPEDLDSMQVTTFETAGMTGTSQTFYEELAIRLGELERRGALAIAQPRGAPPLPPFERWSFAEMRYVQWLVDMHSVHYTLEAAVADATTVAATEHYSSDSEALRRAFDALARFGEAAGLDRSLEIAADLNNMAKASDLEQGVELEPSGNAAAYADYVGRLGLLCTEEDDPSRIEDAALRLLANAYLLHVTHLTTGMRLGAAAAEKLNLFRAQALNFYRTWPDEVLPDPLALCVANVNAAGELLIAEQREIVMEELPRAMPKIGLLLTSLAHAN